MMVRVACRYCSRLGLYRLERLTARYGSRRATAKSAPREPKRATCLPEDGAEVAARTTMPVPMPQ
jgi:hypothetical protein